MTEIGIKVGVGGNGVEVGVKVGSGVQVGIGVGGSAVQKTGCVGVAVRVGSFVPHSGPQEQSIPVKRSIIAALCMEKKAGFIATIIPQPLISPQPLSQRKIRLPMFKRHRESDLNVGFD